MSATRRAAVGMWRRRTGTNPSWTGIATVSLGNDTYGYRLISPMGNSGKYRRTQWNVVVGKTLTMLLAQRSRIDMWNGREQQVKEDVDIRADWVPRFGIIELPVEGAHGGSKFGQAERRAAMAVINDDENLKQLEVDSMPEPGGSALKRSEVLLELLDRTASRRENPVWAPKETKARKKPRKKVEPVTVAVAEADGYPVVAGSGRSRFVQLASGRHYLREFGDTGVTDVDMLRKGRESFSPVLMLGEAGTGKTQSVIAAFGEENIITVIGHEDVEAASFEGRYTPKEGGGWKITIGKLVRAMQEGKVLFIDEIGLISSLVLSIAYSAMDGRRSLEPTLIPDIGVVKAQEGFYVVGATNPRATGARISDAMRSRFPYRPVVTTDYKMAVAHLDVPEDIASAGANLEERRLAREISWSPQLRDLVQYVQAVEDFNDDFALSSLAGKAPEPDQRTVCEVLGREVGRSVRPLATS